MKPNYPLEIQKLPAERLEAFVKDWVAVREHSYHSTERWSGTGDMGRDVVGYVTERRHEGEWDNYQCKQLTTKLSEKDAFVELGKIFMHSAAKAYRLPRAYVFVAPRGMVRNVASLIAHPERFRQAFLDRWDEVCAPNLVESASVPLTAEITSVIREFDFTKVHGMDAAKIADDPRCRPVLVEWFGADPGEVEYEDAPDQVLDEEIPYVRQLIEAYGEREATTFSTAENVMAHPIWGNDLKDQRTRFFHARSFRGKYRECTFPKVLLSFEREIYHGVVDVYRETHADALARMVAVMKEAKGVSATGVLARYAAVPVKQGVCHHFGNEGRFTWKR